MRHVLWHTDRATLVRGYIRQDNDGFRHENAREFTCFRIVRIVHLLYCSRRVAKAGTPTSTKHAPGGRTSRSRGFVRWAVVLLAIAIIIDAIVGERGLLAMLRAREHFEMNASAIEQQRAENARLRTEADRLTNDPAALEELARGELGLMRPGEKVFIVKDLEPPAAH